MPSPPDIPGADAVCRLEAMELKIMDLEIVLQQLNDVVVGQYRDIERMRRDHERLQGQLAQALEGRANGEQSARPADEVPPHY